MNIEQFNELVELVRKSPANPPEMLFAGGYDDWRVRVRLAHFLAMPEFKQMDAALELFRSSVTEEFDEANIEMVEERVYALQRMASCLRSVKDLEQALDYINKAIELIESTDFLYHYLSRGEIWADRWNILHDMGKGDIALDEIKLRMEFFEKHPDIAKYNSYLYYGYRFIAQDFAVQGQKEAAIETMKKALSYMEISPEQREQIDILLNATHDNIGWILNTVDHACPPPNQVHWDI